MAVSHIMDVAKGKLFGRDSIFGGSCVPKLLPLKNSNTTEVPHAARKKKSKKWGSMKDPEA